MKKLKFLAVALVALTLISCSKKDNNGAVPDGTPIFASLAIDFGDTKATTKTDEGVEQEKLAAAYTVDVLVYSNGVLETVAAGLTQTLGKTVEFKTTTGAKNIVAILNLPANVSLPAVNSTIQALQALKATVANSPIAATEEFTMSGMTVETLAASAEGSNIVIDITVNRLTAKISLAVYDNIPMLDVLAADKANATFVKVSSNDAANAPNFALQQTQKYANIFADPAINPAITDPGAVITSPAPNASKKEYENIQLTRPFEYIQAQQDFTAMPFNRSRYCPVNFNEVKTVGNNTFAAIKIKLIPRSKMVVDPDSGLVSYTPHDFSGGDFFGFVYGSKTYAPFENSTIAAAAYNKLSGGSGGVAAVKTWVTGFAYYKIYVGDKRTEALKFGVLANRIYQVNVSSISGFGVSSDEDLIDPDPEVPIEAEAHIQAQITVAPWAVVFFSQGIR